MRRYVTRVALMGAVLVFAGGCATKDWVKELMTKKEAEIGQRVDERVDKVEGSLNDKGQRIGSLETSVGELGQETKQTRGRAEAAYTRADDVDGRLTRLWTGRNRRSLVETVHVQFGFDRADLSDAAQTALLVVIKELKENPNLTVELEGYTDPSGTRDYNVTLSQRRVESVRRYLIENGTELPRIHSVGLGPLNGKAEAAAQQRRVTVKLMVAAE